MTTRTFEPALRQMAATDAKVFGPVPFQEYCDQNSLAGRKTAPSISIDSYDKLAPELKESETMVLRLGSPQGSTGTSFGLIRCAGGAKSFFLFDEDLCRDVTPEIFVPTCSARQLFIFNLLPRLTESSYVNLAIASGVLHHALGLEGADTTMIPATGQSTFTFDVKPSVDVDVEWPHKAGQVEIDAIFLARRGGEETLFLVEAKTGRPRGSVAKHKLFYPRAALWGSVPEYMKIAPVFLRAWPSTDGLHFLVVECGFQDEAAPAVNSLERKSAVELVLPTF